MAIDVENIQLEAHRVTKLAFTYVKNHPILAIFVSFLFILCLFLRSLFVFLFFVVPIFIFIAVSFRLIFHIHQQNLRNAKGDTSTYDNSSSRKLTPNREVKNLDRRAYSSAHARSVRRRHSRKNEMHVHFQDENNIVSSTTNDNDLVDKSAVVEETPKEIREIEIKSTTDSRFNSDEDGNKAVEWNENDQKNLNDLGFSEMERNKRLESLMAKRKARKLLTLQVRRTLMNIRRDEPSSEIASILIPKMGVFENNKSSEALISPTPGSAPSVLLPVHNPFDIPYDPQEEKPNLTGFYQEDLVENHQKDAVFCRHESFSLGTISPGPWELYSPSETRHHLEYAIRPVTREIPEFSRFREQSGKEEIGEITEVETSQENDTIPCTDDSHDPNQPSEACENASDLIDVHNEDGTKEVDDDPKLDTYDNHKSSSSSSSEINAPFSAANRDEILRSLSFSLRKNLPVTEIDSNVRRDALSYYENPSPFENSCKNDQNGMLNIHMRSQSLASDLQVELSEVGSQTNLSSDGESLEYEVEGNSGNEDVWVASSHLKRVEENEARSGEVCKVSEQDIIKVGFSRINQDIEEPIDLESNLSQSGNFVDKVHEERLSNNNLALHQNGLENLEEPYNSAENNIATDEKIFYDINDQIDVVNEDDQGIIDLIEDTYGEDLDCMNERVLQDLSENNITQENSKQLQHNNPNFVELHVAESEFKGNNNSQVREVVAENGPSEASSSSSTMEDKDQVGTSEFNPSLARPIEPVMFLGVDPTPMAVIPEVEVEQVAVVSSPSSSPNSVLQHKFSVDNLSHNMSFDDVHMASQQSNVEMEQNDSFLEDSIIEQTHAGDSVGLQESSFPLGHSSADNTNYNTRDEPVQMSDNRTNIDSITSTEENEKSKQ